MPPLLAQHAQDPSPWLIVAAAGAVVLIGMLLASALLRRKSAATPPRSGPQPASSAQHRAIERDIKDLMHELSEMTRRATAQLDARSAKLEQLIRDADLRLAKLGAVPPTATTTPSSNGDSREPAAASSLSHATIADAASEDVIDPRHVEIYTLCEQGLSTQQIADRLHRPSGEVELIIALRPRSRALLESSPD